MAARQHDASELAALLSGLTAHIGHDDTDCPVCATRFEPGDLQRRARNALAAQDVQLAEQARSVGALADATEAARQELAKAQAVIFAAAEAENLARNAEEAADMERAAIAEALNVPADTDLTALIGDRLAQAGRARAAHVRDAGGSSNNVSTAQSRLNALTASLASLDERLAITVQRRTVNETTLKSIGERLATLEQPWSSEAANSAVEAQGKVLEAARASLDDLTVKRAAAANAESAARERLATAQADRDRIAAVTSDASAARDRVPLSGVASAIAVPSGQSQELVSLRLAG
ncbi:hypothetical protein ACFOHY_11660 [Rhizobium rosettiformans]|uniref:hypothetical protein n=1 Tax=Rhizobium rosettiformans TaxID=1368430 RepID=UPI00360D354D